MTESLQPHPDTIPEVLRAIPRWLLWQWIVKDGKMTKVPLDLQERAADYTVPAAWHDFPTVWARYEARRQVGTSKVAGVGFILDGSDRITLFDYDHEIDLQALKAGHDVTRAWRTDGTLDPTVRAYLDTLQTYTEVSTSGRGVHALVRGDLPAFHRKKNARGECYTGRPGCRFFTVTGHRLPEYPATLEDRPAAVLEVYTAMFGPLEPPVETPPAAATAVDVDDDTLIQLARDAADGLKFAQLWAGDCSAYSSQSEADLALASLLAFWTGGDPTRIDRLFRRSALMRAKWDAPRQSTTYGAMTITKALAGKTDVYTPAIAALVGGGDAVPAGVTLDAPRPAGPAPATETTAVSETPTADSDTETRVTPEPPPLYVVGGPDDPTPPPPPADPTFRLVTPADSFISRYVTYCALRTDAPLLAHEAVACAVLSALAGPGVRIPLAATIGGKRLILWTMYVANTTLSRKTTTLDLGTDVLTQVLGPEAILSWEGSPQAFIQKLAGREGQPTVHSRDEQSAFMAQINKGGHMAGMAQVLIRAYDGKILENLRTTKRDKNTGKLINDSDRALDPYLVQLAASAEDRLLSTATIDNVLDGLLSRFHFYTGTVSPRPEPEETAATRQAREEVLAHARRFRARCQRLTTVPLDPAVHALRWALEQAWQARAAASPQAQAVEASLKRLGDSVLKIAALLAIDLAPVDQVPRITVALFQMGRAIVDRWLPTTVRVVETVGQTIFARQCRTILDFIQHRPAGVSLRTVYKALNLRKRDCDEVLATLQARGQIRAQDQPRPGRGGVKQILLYPVAPEEER